MLHQAPRLILTEQVRELGEILGQTNMDFIGTSIHMKRTRKPPSTGGTLEVTRNNNFKCKSLLQK